MNGEDFSLEPTDFVLVDERLNPVKPMLRGMPGAVRMYDPKAHIALTTTARQCLSRITPNVSQVAISEHMEGYTKHLGSDTNTSFTFEEACDPEAMEKLGLYVKHVDESLAKRKDMWVGKSIKGERKPLSKTEKNSNKKLKKLANKSRKKNRS